jgi:hypothetical protein
VNCFTFWVFHRRLGAGFSLPGSGYIHGAVRVGFVLD